MMFELDCVHHASEAGYPPLLLASEQYLEPSALPIPCLLMKMSWIPFQSSGVCFYRWCMLMLGLG